MVNMLPIKRNDDWKNVLWNPSYYPLLYMILHYCYVFLLLGIFYVFIYMCVYVYMNIYDNSYIGHTYMNAFLLKLRLSHLIL